MRKIRIVTIPLTCALFSIPLLSSEDLSRYRGFQLESDLSVVAKQAGMEISEARVIHQQPAVIQELEWQPRSLASSASEIDPVQLIVFSFYNGELYRMTINYDRSRTGGLTTEDVIDAISAKYGKAARPAAEIFFPSVFNDRAKVLAQWEDERYSVNLVRTPYDGGFGMVMLSKRLDAQAQASIVEAVRLEAQEAPAREAALVKKKADDARAEREKERLANKPNFRP
jgi:hypothetical protein